MAKQQKKGARRAPKAAEPRMYGDGTPSQPEAQQATATAPVSTPAAPRSSATPAPRTTAGRTAGMTPRGGAGAAGSYTRVDRIADYSYVIHDLRKLGVVAASILGGLIVLGVILH